MTKTKTRALLFITLIVIGWLILFTRKAWKAPYTPSKTPEQIMGDSLPGIERRGGE